MKFKYLSLIALLFFNKTINTMDICSSKAYTYPLLLSTSTILLTMALFKGKNCALQLLSGKLFHNVQTLQLTYINQPCIMDANDNNYRNFLETKDRFKQFKKDFKQSFFYGG